MSYSKASNKIEPNGYTKSLDQTLNSYVPATKPGIHNYAWDVRRPNLAWTEFSEDYSGQGVYLAANGLCDFEKWPMSPGSVTITQIEKQMDKST